MEGVREEGGTLGGTELAMGAWEKAREERGEGDLNSEPRGDIVGSVGVEGNYVERGEGVRGEFSSLARDGGSLCGDRGGS